MVIFIVTSVTIIIIVITERERLLYVCMCVQGGIVLLLGGGGKTDNIIKSATPFLSLVFMMKINYQRTTPHIYTPALVQ